MMGWELQKAVLARETGLWREKWRLQWNFGNKLPCLQRCTHCKSNVVVLLVHRYRIGTSAWTQKNHAVKRSRGSILCTLTSPLQRFSDQGGDVDVAHGSLRRIRQSSGVFTDFLLKATFVPRGSETYSIYNLGQVAVPDVYFSHALQPSASKLRGAGVGISQTVLEVHQHLWILLMLLHLCCCH